MSEVDITQLALERREPPAGSAHGRHLLTRYLLPALLLASFTALVGWLARDLVFPPRQVTVVPVLATRAAARPEGTPMFPAAGWIEPRPTIVRVAALAPGVVQRLLVVEDQPVKAGEPVAELVKADAELAYDQALADRKLRQAELEETQAALTAATTRLEQPVHLQAELGQADASLAEIETQLAQLPFEQQRAKAALLFAQKNHDGKVAAGGAVSGRSLDAAKNQVDAAAALVDELSGRSVALQRQRNALLVRRDALKKQLELLAGETQARDAAIAQVKAAEARLEQAGVEVATAKLMLERMTIRAPIDGRVYQLVALPGARLGTEARSNGVHDSSTVITMYDPKMLQVRVDVRFEDIPKVSLGQSVRVNNPALPEPVIGSVLLVSSEADIQKNTLEVKVAIPSPPSVLKPEMLVDVTFLAPASVDNDQPDSLVLHIFLPEQCIEQEDGQQFVWVADQTRQRARKMNITTGSPGPEGLVEVTDGVTIGSRIICGDRSGLSDGQRIRVVGEDPPPIVARARSN